MYAVSTTFLPALRAAHGSTSRVDAYRSGQLIASDLPIDDGSVTEDASSPVRRKLDLQISDRTLWDILAPIGAELHPSRGVVYPDGATEMIPLGVFGIDSQSMSVAPDGTLDIRQAPDRWARVQRARFTVPANSVKTALAREEIRRLVTAVVNVPVLMSATSTAVAGALVWQRDRDKAALDLAKAIAAEVFFDNVGNLVVRDLPKLSAAPVWTIDASSTGVLLDGTRERDRLRTYNAVVVFPAAVDGSPVFTTQIAYDTDPNSPTWIGGPFGIVPYFYSSPVIKNATQAIATARSLLPKVKSLNAQLTTTSVVNPALQAGDVIEAVLPGGVTERQLVESVTTPLVPEREQQISYRSSRPDGDVPDEE